METAKHSKVVVIGLQSKYRKLPVIGVLLDQLLAWFSGQGYSESTVRNYLKGIRALFLWLKAQHSAPLEQITQEDWDLVYMHFRKKRPKQFHSVRIVGLFLQQKDIIQRSAPVIVDPVEVELSTFAAYLRSSLGLADSTIIGHRTRLKSFLQFLGYAQNHEIVKQISLEEIEAFLRKSSQTNNRFSLQHIVASLRSYLRYLYNKGLVKRPLYQQIDTARTYRLEKLPRAVPWQKIVSLLGSIKPETPIEIRNYTMLYLVARYGLRSTELVSLSLDDIDWRKGVLRIAQTKTKQSLRFPLTKEAGDILMNYLKNARTPCQYRQLFLRQRAPIGPLSHYAVHDILQLQVQRSGLDITGLSPHGIRHSFALHLLRRGVPVHVIGQTLGHRDPESTSVYLRLDVDDLREVGLPVPISTAVLSFDEQWKSKIPPAYPQKRAKNSEHTEFVSAAASSLKTYIATKRALGRKFDWQEKALLNWDQYLFEQVGDLSEQPLITSEVFHRWTRCIARLTSTVQRSQMLVVRNFLIFHARKHPDTYIPDLLTFPQNSACKLPRIVSEDEMGRILKAAQQLPASKQNPLRSHTVKLALVILFCCGLRRGELLRLKLKDFDSNENLLHIESTKFNKSRVIALTESVAEQLQGYLKLRKSQKLAFDPESYLLWSNNPLAKEHVYSAPALAHNWQCLCVAAQVLDEQKRPPRIHDLRHSFAVAALHRWYRSGTDVNTKLQHLCTYLGHSSVASTLHYLHFTPELQKDAAELFHQKVQTIFEEGGPK